MAGISESHRKRVSFTLLGVGLFLVLLGFVVLMTHTAAPDQLTISTRPVDVPTAAKARALRQMLFYLVMLVIVFVISSTAFLRWSRNFRRSLLRKPKPPTPSEDVWAMHKLPEGAVDAWTDSGPGPTDEPDRPQ